MALILFGFVKNDTDLLNLFNKNPPFPNQASWTVFSPTNAVSMKVIAVLRMQHFDGRVTNDMASDGGILSKVTIRPRCAVQ